MLSWPRCQSLDVAIAIKSFIRDQIRTLVVMILPQKERGHYWFVLFSILAINVQRCGQCMHTVHHFMFSDTPPTLSISLRLLIPTDTAWLFHSQGSERGRGLSVEGCSGRDLMCLSASLPA